MPLLMPVIVGLRLDDSGCGFLNLGGVVNLKIHDRPSDASKQIMWA